MGRFVDLTGRRVGKLVVLKRSANKVSPRGKSAIYWLVRCSCGKEYDVMAGHLRSGKTTKCLDCKYKNMQLNGRMSATMYARIKWNAKVRDIEFDKSLTKEYLYNLFIEQNRKCALTGLDICFANTIYEGGRGKTTASLDRKNSDLSYQIGNVQWVHKDVNKMKGSSPFIEFIEWCKDITSYQSWIKKI